MGRVFECNELNKWMKASIIFIINDFLFELYNGRLYEKFGLFRKTLD